MKEQSILMSGPMIPATLDGRKTKTRRVVTPHTSTINGPTCERWLWDELDFSNAWVDNSPVSPAGNPGPYLKVPMPRDDAVQRVYPRWFPGDILWIRETWGSLDADHPLCPDGRKPQDGDQIVYRANPADDYQWGSGRPSQGSFVWRPSIHMPRWASRLTLEVVAVRVERLQEISEEDAIAEGGVWTDNGPRKWARVRGLTFDQANSVNGWNEGWSHTGETDRDKCLGSARMSFANLWNTINAKRGFSWESNCWVWVVEFKVLEEAAP